MLLIEVFPLWAFPINRTFFFAIVVEYVVVWVYRCGTATVMVQLGRQIRKTGTRCAWNLKRAGGGLAGDGQAIARRQDAMAGKQGSRAESM